MALDFTVVTSRRHQFGFRDRDIGTFAGLDYSWEFDCPDVAPEFDAMLLCQVSGVHSAQNMPINGVEVVGGVPAGDTISGTTSNAGFGVSQALLPRHAHRLREGGSTEAEGFGTDSSSGDFLPTHTHAVLSALGWGGRILIVSGGVLRTTGNVLRIGSATDDFLIDNIVVLFKARARPLPFQA